MQQRGVDRIIHSIGFAVDARARAQLTLAEATADGATGSATTWLLVEGLDATAVVGVIAGLLVSRRRGWHRGNSSARSGRHWVSSIPSFPASRVR
ncbi:hypothetical protein AB0H00_26090 [Nocardia sp. NPDC023852]|uniref:hypothetical protein n=1 Tax=Nocardia sp. NPDC023852 TaxID=3154697 RepID=UPI0033C6DE92